MFADLGLISANIHGVHTREINGNSFVMDPYAVYMHLCVQARTPDCERAHMHSCLSPLQTSGLQNGVHGPLLGPGRRVLSKIKSAVTFSMRDFTAVLLTFP